MKNKRLNIHLASVLSLMVPAALLLFVATASPALAHGGKEHAAADFTSFKALEKATGLYNRLLSSGKLDASWETGLKKVTIAAPSPSGGKEFVVTFHRSQGKPQAVYFFFTGEGKYAGSNFTGP